MGLMWCQVRGKFLVKPAWLFPRHLVVGKSENKTTTRKTKAGSGISVLSTEKKKERNKEGRKEEPLQIEL